MKIFTSSQIHELDSFTIEHEPVQSIDLMERAAKVMTHVIMERWDKHTPVAVFAGPGNNGGDALAVARMLAKADYSVDVYLFNIHNKLSADCEINKKRLLDANCVRHFTEVTVNFDLPDLTARTLVVDGLFGSGLNKPLAGGFASLVKYINQSPSKVVSLDMPSGMMTENNTDNIWTNIVKADLTLTLQQKKLAMMFADCQPYLGEVRVLDIRLSQDYIDSTDAQFVTVEENDVRRMLQPRADFVHKGLMGYALIIAGQYGMAGAAVLATKACLRSGVGKVAVLTPQLNNDIMQISVPEAILVHDAEDAYFSEATDTDGYDAMAIGPGLGVREQTSIALISQLRRTTCPIVADADALNIIANHRAWVQQLPQGIILTPHPREFDRLAGGISNSDYDRLAKAIALAARTKAYILLKGHYSALCCPDHHVYFNTTGNSGMATAGAGDVLTGIITGLLARGYEQREACMLGMYLHGLAGDIAVKSIGKESLIASDIIKFLPMAFQRLEE